MRRIIFIALTFAWMLVIFSFSAKPADKSEDLSLSIGCIIGQIIVPDFEEWPIKEQEAFAEEIDYPVRKCAHATEYAILGFCLAGTIVEGKHHRRRHFFLCLIIGVAYAARDEFHQLFVPSRAGMVTDVLIDSCGVGIGLLIAYLIGCLQRKNIHTITKRLNDKTSRQ